MWSAMKFVVFDNKGKGAYVTLGNEFHYYELNGSVPPRLIKVAGVPNQYEEDGSFWLRNRQATELVHYSPKPGGIVKQLAKHKYAKGYDPNKVTGEYAFLEGAAELIVLAKGAKGVFKPHYAIYSYSPNEANVKRAAVK